MIQKLTKDEALKVHYELIDKSVPKWDLTIINSLHAFADGKCVGWCQAGIITNAELDKLRKELSDAVSKRDQEVKRPKWWDLADRLGL